MPSFIFTLEPFCISYHARDASYRNLAAKPSLTRSTKFGKKKTVDRNCCLRTLNIGSKFRGELGAWSAAFAYYVRSIMQVIHVLSLLVVILSAIFNWLRLFLRSAYLKLQGTYEGMVIISLLS